MIFSAVVVSIVVVTSPCGDPTNDGCYDQGRIEVTSLDPYIVQHELAHAFDLQLMTPTDRDWFTRQTAANASVSPPERFADIYATCALNGLFPSAGDFLITEGYGAMYPIRIYRRLCRHLRYWTSGIKYTK